MWGSDREACGVRSHRATSVVRAEDYLAARLPEWRAVERTGNVRVLAGQAYITEHIDIISADLFSRSPDIAGFIAKVYPERYRILSCGRLAPVGCETATRVSLSA